MTDAAIDIAELSDSYSISGTGVGQPQGLLGNLGAGVTEEPDSQGNLEMEKSGITLIPAFRTALVQAATIQADLAVAYADIRKTGRYIVSKTGVKKINPAVEDTHKLNEKLSRALYALSITPKALGGNVAKDH